MKIGIDMGHSLSGAGTGAKGITGYEEVKMNRLVGNRLIAMLKEHGHTVINCTVDKATSSDSQLNGIVAKATAQSLDVFLSLHLNAFNGSAYGVETYICSGSYPVKAKNKLMAQAIQKELVAKIGWSDRGVKEQDYRVLKGTKDIAILVELGFCDNKSDMAKWNTEKIAMALYKGLTGVEYAKKVVPVTKKYRVIAGTFGVLENANNQVNILKAKGISSYVEEVK